MKLHKMKISQLILGKGELDKTIDPYTLNQWAIAIVRNYKEIVETFKFPYQDSDKVIDIRCGDDITKKGNIQYCKACKRFIDKFELKESDIHGN